MRSLDRILRQSVSLFMIIHEIFGRSISIYLFLDLSLVISIYCNDIYTDKVMRNTGLCILDQY